MKASEDLVISIRHIANDELVHLKLNADVGCRRTELESKLGLFNLYFGDEVTLYEDDIEVALLESSSEELDSWLDGEDL